MTALDVPGRNLGALNLSLLGAGVASSGGVGVGVGPSVGGQRPRNNSFNIEGVDNNRKDVAGPNVYLPNEATAEFTLLQNQFAPEFGHSSGGQFNLIAKSGTNADPRIDLPISARLPEPECDRSGLCQSGDLQQYPVRPEPVRLHGWRTDCQEQDLLLSAIIGDV